MTIKRPPKSKLKKPLPPPPGDAPTATQARASTKKFKVESWDTGKEGKRIIGYGDTGIGKSSLALLAPNTVWLGLDEGAGQLRHPVTGEPPMRIPGIETFADVRAALQDVLSGL